MITILAVGKAHEDWIQAGLQRYQKRLRAPFNIEWVLLPHSAREGDSARQEESGRILKRLDYESYVVLLDERGTSFSSLGFSELLESQLSQSRPITIIIGGAYGVNDELHRRSSVVISLSDMVLPHQLVRLVLIEQLYRAQEIRNGGKYHHS
jgi:23S rRNA (pseudouridine1915-N3)-methyltransferase